MIEVPREVRRDALPFLIWNVLGDGGEGLIKGGRRGWGA